MIATVVATAIVSVPVQPDRDGGRRLLEDELAGRAYRQARPGLVQQGLQWLFDQLGKLHYTGADPARPALVVIALTLVAAALGYALYRSGGFRRLARRPAPAVPTGSRLSAGQRRALAERAAAAGDWDTAVVERFRAVALVLEERAVLPPLPGRTAREVAGEAGAALPRQAAELDAAAAAFDRVSYGRRPVGEAGYRRVASLDDALAAERVGPSAERPALAGERVGPAAQRVAP